MGPKPPHFLGFIITLGHTTLGWIPADEWSARRRDLYQTIHNTHNRHPCPGGIRIRVPGKQAAVDPRLRPRGDWINKFLVLYKAWKLKFLTLNRPSYSGLKHLKNDPEIHKMPANFQVLSISTFPPGERKISLQVLRRLWKKYISKPVLCSLLQFPWKTMIHSSSRSK
jgi:hypothetical protein